MEVIKHGDTYKRVECPKCGALLSYCKADIKVDNRYDEYNRYNGERNFSYKEYINCPECKERITLSWIIDGEERLK